MTNRDQSPKSLIEWLGFRNPPNWAKAQFIGAGLGALLLLVSTLLFIAAIVAAFFVISGVVFADGALSVGSGALIAALLGAPFLIWGTVLKHLTVAFQKEGHMTDRITKAVEQLGAEKAVERIGRPVTIWTGKRESTSYDEDRAKTFIGNERTKLGGKEWSQSYNHETDEVDEGYRITVSTWPEERTVIQWQGELIELKDNDVIGSEGPWQVFKETQPNIEVRIGAILSMERIAQDSTRHDMGRDHVRIMEILCAYVRENTPVSLATFDEFPNGCLQNTLDKKANFRPTDWIYSLDRPRSDIQLAISVIGRRSAAQIKVENRHVDGKRLGYTLDLSHTMLRKVDFEGLNFSKASFFRCCMEGIFAENADFSDCNFVYANLTGANASRANLSQSKLKGTDLSYSHLTNSNLQNCALSHTHFVRSDLRNAKLQFSENKYGSQVNRAFFVYSDLSESFIQGDMIGVIIQFLENGGDRTPDYAHGIRFKNARLGRRLSLLDSVRTEISYSEELLGIAFGDSTVVLPEGVSRPAHWPIAELDSSCFDNEWAKWLSNPSEYVPPVR